MFFSKARCPFNLVSAKRKAEACEGRNPDADFHKEHQTRKVVDNWVLQ